MDVREKLVDIVCDAMEADGCIGHCNYPPCFAVERVVNALIAHGVTVQELHSASNPPKEDGTYLVQTNTGTITTARFYAFKSFPATKYLPACHRSSSWQSNRNVVKWTYLPQPPKGE